MIKVTMITGNARREILLNKSMILRIEPSPGRTREARSQIIFVGSPAIDVIESMDDLETLINA